MAITLVTTVGSATANSYASVAEFQAYIANRPAGVTAEESDAEAIKQYLVAAMDILERLPFTGTPMGTAQALWFPAYSGYDSSKFFDKRGREYVTTAIPQKIKDVQCQIAQAIRRDASMLDLEEGGEVLFSAGSVRIEEKPALHRIRESAMRELADFVDASRGNTRN